MRKLLKALYKTVTSPFIALGLVVAAVVDGYQVGRQHVWGQFLRWWVEEPNLPALPLGYASQPGERQ